MMIDEEVWNRFITSSTNLTTEVHLTNIEARNLLYEIIELKTAARRWAKFTEYIADVGV